MKIESKKWKDYSEKCNHCCEINLIFNRKLSYKHFQTKSPNKTIEKLRRKTILSIGNIVNTTDLLPRNKRKFIPEKKKGSDPPLIAFLPPPHRRRNNEYPRRRRRKIPGFESSAVIDYLPCTRRIGFEKFFFPKRRKKYRGEKAPPTFDAFGNDDRSARKSEKVRKITTKRTRN